MWAGVRADEWTYGPLLEASRRAGHRQRARTYGRRMLLSFKSSGLPLSPFCLASLRRSIGINGLQQLARECDVRWDDVEAALARGTQGGRQRSAVGGAGAGYGGGPAGTQAEER